MAWRARINFITGDKPTAADFNNQGLDTRGWGGNVDASGPTTGGPWRLDGLKGFTAPGQPHVLAVNVATVTLTNATWTVIPWDNNSTGVAYNVGGMHSTSVNPSRFTALVAGLYLIGGTVGFATNATGERIVRIQKNGTVIPTFQNVMAVTGDNTFVGVAPMPLVLAVNDYVEIAAYQTSGGNLATYATNTLGWMYQIG